VGAVNSGRLPHGDGRQFARNDGLGWETIAEMDNVIVVYPKVAV
jgi:hypothetical protein